MHALFFLLSVLLNMQNSLLCYYNYHYSLFFFTQYIFLFTIWTWMFVNPSPPLLLPYYHDERIYRNILSLVYSFFSPFSLSYRDSTMHASSPHTLYQQFPVLYFSCFFFGLYLHLPNSLFLSASMQMRILFFTSSFSVYVRLYLRRYCNNTH